MGLRYRPDLRERDQTSHWATAPPPTTPHMTYQDGEASTGAATQFQASADP